jgi:hypothetical protein
MADEDQASDQANNPKRANSNPFSAAYARFKLLPITWRVVGGALLGVVILGAVACLLPNMKDRMKFFTDATLSWLILVVVAAQAYIYSKQWKVMERQAKSADESVVFGLRAYVGVKDISNIDFNNKRILLLVENIGKVPAKDINVSIEIEVRIPEKWADEQSKQPPWVQMGNLSQSLTWKINHDYGRIRLSPGSLHLTVPVALDSWLGNGYMFLIWQGKAEIFFRGNIGFHDGFHRGKNSPFSFRYSRREEAWITHPILTQADIEQKLAERTKRYFGDEEPQFNFITAHIPPTQAKIETETDADGKDKGKKAN